LLRSKVADDNGISESHLWRLEKGETTASPETAAKLAAYFVIDEREILYPERYMQKAR
jgi:transcriptional regulator with XRE-family HTH domain